jgi:hypothetical protein
LIRTHCRNWTRRMSAVSDKFVRAIRSDEIAPGGMKAVDVEGKEIVVCNCGGTYYAFDRRCGHMNAPLDLGTLDKARRRPKDLNGPAAGERETEPAAHRLRDLPYLPHALRPIRCDHRRSLVGSGPAGSGPRHLAAPVGDVPAEHRHVDEPRTHRIRAHLSDKARGRLGRGRTVSRASRGYSGFCRTCSRGLLRPFRPQ